MRAGARCATLRHVASPEDDHATPSAILTLPGRPEALRDDSTGKGQGKGSGRAPTANGELAEGSGRLPNGATLGRYVVTGCVGAGGMGVVYSARDPDLDRR